MKLDRNSWFLNMNLNWIWIWIIWTAFKGEIAFQVFSITEIALLGWQTSVIGNCREQLPFVVSQWPSTCTNLPQECPCTSDMDIEKMTSVLNAVFIIQILNLINVGFLLLGSFCLIYGVYSGSKFWLWAWLPPGVLSVPFLLAYCISWWAGVRKICSVSNFRILDNFTF
jgi:hypothetical protein